MAFDPDKYLASANSAPQSSASEGNSGGFDPEAYLKKSQSDAFARNKEIVSQKPKKTVAGSAAVGARQGFLMGYSPQVEAMTEAITAKIFDALNDTHMYDELPSYVERRDKAAANMEEYKKDNPKAFLAGEVAGGALSTAPIAAAVPLKGVGALAKVKQAAKVGGVTGALINPGDKEGEVNVFQAGDRTKNALTGMAVGTAVQGGMEVGAKGVNSMGKVLRQAGEFLDENLPTLKKDWKEIVTAAKRQGVEITPGMIYDGDKFHALEQSLADSPSLFNRIGKIREKIVNGIGKRVEENLDDASPLNNYEVGDRVRKGIQTQFEDRLKPVGEQFNEIAKHTGAVDVSRKGVDRVAKNIHNLDEARLTRGAGGSVESKINTYTKILQNVENVNDLKKVGTMLGEDIRASEGPEREVLSRMLEKVRRLEYRNMQRAALETAGNPDEGAKNGAQILGELSNARRAYSNIQNDAREMANQAGIKGENWSELNRNLSKLTPEEVAKKFFNTGDSNLLAYMKTKFPNQFEDLRQLKMKEILGGVVSPSTGEINTTAFIRKVNSIPEGLREMVLGSKDKVRNVDDLKTLWQSLPKGFNPSGTGRALDWQQFLTANVRDLGRVPMYKAMTSSGLKRAAGQLKNIKDVTAPATDRTLKLLGGAEEGLLSPRFEQTNIDPAILDLVSQNPEILDSIQDPNLKFQIQKRIGRQPNSETPDLVEAGNIDLKNRPRVKNPDGSISTVRSLGVNIDGQEVLIPTVSEDGRIMTDKEAIEQYHKTGRHLGKFKSQEASDRYAIQLHNDQEKMLNEKPLKGEAKWAASGAANLGLSPEQATILASSNKGRQLLIQASEAKKGSKMLENIRRELEGMKGKK